MPGLASEVTPAELFGLVLEEASAEDAASAAEDLVERGGEDAMGSMPMALLMHGP